MNNILKKIESYNFSDMNKFCKKQNLETLHSLKLLLDDLYYNTGESKVTDNCYDALKTYLIKVDPEYVPPVGAKIRSSENRVKIPFWMGSADKITPDEKIVLDRWIKKNPCKKLVISEKLDGVSGIFMIKNGVKKLYTRGDGEVGADISYLIQYIQSIPKLEDDITVRGELIIKKDIFDKKYYDNGKEEKKDKGYGKTYRNARNMVAGLVGAKTVRPGLVDIDFVVYEIVGDETMPKPSDQFNNIKKLGFIPAMNDVIKTTDIITDWVDIHNKFKKKSKYEIDGIVVQSDVQYDRNTSGNPSYLFAFKINSTESIYSTTVLDIEWSISSWGNIIPVAIIDPIELQGNTMKRVSVGNASLMKSKCIGPGAIINVTRSKDVIPFIVSVSKTSNNLKWPDVNFVWDENNVNIIVDKPNSETIACMKVKMFANFFAKMGIKHVSTATIRKMYDYGLTTLLSIISAKKNNLIEIEGINDKSADRIIENIKKGLINVNAPELLGAASVFGFGVGRKRVISLMTDIPDLLTAPKKGLLKRIMEVEGFSTTMAEKVFSNIDTAVSFVDAISQYVSFTNDTRVSDTLVGMKFVMSGFRSKELEQNIVDRGGKTSTSVSKKTSGVIVAATDSKSSAKVSKAIELGVPVYTKEDFIKKFI